MHNDITRLRALFAKIMDLHHEILDHVLEVNKKSKEQTYSDPDMTDGGYLLREVGSLLNECRKEAEQSCELFGKILAARIIQRSVSNPNASDMTRGTLASAQANMKMEAQIPKSGTMDYDLFLRHIGLPDPVAKTGLLKPDWKKVSEYVTKRAEDGKTTTPGLGKTWPKYSCTFRKIST